MTISKETLSGDDIGEQKRLTAEYLRSKITLEEYKNKMNKVTTPLDLVRLASKLKFKPRP